MLEIEPENADPVRLFRQMRTQWHTQSLVVGRHVVTMRTGLDYGALAPVASALGIALTESVMDGLREMEAEALAIHRRRQDEILRR